MRLKELSLILLLLIPVQGYEVTVLLKNYEGIAMLKIYNETGVFFSGNVYSGETISLPAGNYTFELGALNKTFIKKLEIAGNEGVEFNLGFTSSTENLSLMLHSSVAENGSVDEVIVIVNKGEMNFEGDLVIPMPAFNNLLILAKNLDFLDYEVLDDAIVFKSLLVPENGSGSIRITYDLASEEMARNLGKERVIIIPIAEVLEYRNLTYKIEDFGGEKIALLEGNGSYYVKFRFVDYSLSPLVFFAILLISASLFYLFFERRGNWEE